MLTYNEVRELVLAGEFVAVLRLLLAHRLVFTEDTQGDVTGSLTSFSIQMMVAQPGCDRHITITLNSDGSPGVDVFPEQAPLSYLDDYFGLGAYYGDEVDPNTGKNLGEEEPWMEQMSPQEELEVLVAEVCQALSEEGHEVQSIYHAGHGDPFCCLRLPQGDLIVQACDPRSADEIAEFMLERLESN